MLDENDITVLEKVLDGKFGELRGEMRQEFGKVREEMALGFQTVRDDIVDVIDQNIQPQLTSLAARMTRLERRIA